LRGACFESLPGHWLSWEFHIVSQSHLNVSIVLQLGHHCFHPYSFQFCILHPTMWSIIVLIMKVLLHNPQRTIVILGAHFSSDCHFAVFLNMVYCCPIYPFWIWCSHDGANEQCSLLGGSTVQFGDSLIFWRNITPPSWGLKSKPSLFRQISYLAYSSTLKVEMFFQKVGLCLEYTILTRRDLYSLVYPYFRFLVCKYYL
jgi:hypothetical protein